MALDYISVDLGAQWRERTVSSGSSVTDLGARMPESIGEKMHIVSDMATFKDD